MTKEQKKPVLAACLHCGGDDLFISKYYGPIYVFCDNCGAEGPKETTEAEAVAAWNRRYVCPDKNGKPVYSDSIVRISASRTGYQSDRYSIAWDETYLHWHFHPLDGSYIETVFTNNVSVDEIELIESEAGND